MSDDLVKRARHNAIADMPHYASVELIEALADRIEELEAKLAKATYKSAALVYSDMTEGDHIACDFALFVAAPLTMRIDFLSTFCLEVKRTQAPVGVVFYIGTTLVGYQDLQALGLRQTARQGDTITIQPASQN